MMIKQGYTVRFVTPAFLGNAEQQGQWRTPPFKALLRQWWRVAAAKDYGYNHQRLRDAEGKLFGNAWIEEAFCKSKVRLRLDRWDELISAIYSLTRLPITILTPGVTRLVSPTNSTSRLPGLRMITIKALFITRPAEFPMNC
jgi:hypothetical protein